MKLRRNTVFVVLRGCAFDFDSSYLRVTHRITDKQVSLYWDNGFRFVIRSKR